MNWLDIIMIILAVAIFVGAIACLVYWISYGTRVGLYSTNKCYSAPVEEIEAIND